MEPSEIYLPLCEETKKFKRWKRMKTKVSKNPKILSTKHTNKKKSGKN